jgi:hypothetical protein
VSAFEGAKGEVLGEGCLADAGLAAEEYILSTADEVECFVELLVGLSVDGTRVIPIEAVKRLGCAEGGHLHAACKVSSLTLSLLEGTELLCGLRGRGLGLGCVGEPCLDGLSRGAKADFA